MAETPPELVREIGLRLAVIQRKVALAAEKSCRSASEVMILAVSKRQPSKIIEAAYACGLRTFGENYAEEAAEKITQLAHLDDIRWEMVGHVQSRKSALVAQHFVRMHSLDSLKLARKLDAVRSNQVALPPLEVLLQLNVSGEASKGGFLACESGQWEALLLVAQEVRSLGNLRLTGLMTMPPLFEDPEFSRPYFRRLREARDYLNEEIPELGLKELSMGTSADYSVAVEEGATIIRIGTELLGPRSYTKEF